MVVVVAATHRCKMQDVLNSVAPAAVPLELESGVFVILLSSC